MENWISGSASSHRLRTECQQTRFLRTGEGWQQYCEDVPLDSREVELLHSPINSAVAELLLPREPARPDSTWKISSEDAAELFQLDAVHESTLEAKIAKVEKGIASIELKGTLNATANSVATTLRVNGNFRVRLAQECALVILDSTGDQRESRHQSGGARL